MCVTEITIITTFFIATQNYISIVRVYNLKVLMPFFSTLIRTDHLLQRF